MTDIIARAKELAANGHTPGPWNIEADEISPDWVQVMGPIQLTGNLITQATVMGETDADDPELEVMVFAPEAVAALAQDTWEYGVQCRESDEEWGWSGWSMTIGFHKQRTRESCEKFIESRRTNTRFQYRLVRRRVSPVEVIE